MTETAIKRNMTREQLIKFAREELNKHGLQDWSLRLTNSQEHFGTCFHSDKCIALSSHHLDTHPDIEVIDTIRHEIAHALTPNHAHDSVWQAKAKELGARPNATCPNLSFSPQLINAIRSGATIEIEYETKFVPTVTQTEVHVPKYKISRLQERCPICNEVAREKHSKIYENPNPFEPDLKYISLECGHLISRKIPKGTPFQTLVTNHLDDHVKACKHDWEVNRCKKCQEFKLFPFQVDGARFIETALATNKGCLVADEMGLGKTIQVLSYLYFHPEAFPVLFVTKSALKYNWFLEHMRLFGTDYTPQILETSNDFVIPKLKCYIASYDLFVFKTRTNQKTGKVTTQGFDINKLKARGIKTIIFDECQQIKDPDAARTKAARELARDPNVKVIGISGTPFKNRGSELFTILNLIAPTKFADYARFCTKWVDTYEYGSRTVQGGIRNVPAFREYTKDIIIRREVSEVQKEMPEVNTQIMHVEMSKIDQSQYNEDTEEFVKWWEGVMIGGEEEGQSAINILAKIAKMRHTIGLAKVEFAKGMIDQFIEETDRKLCIYHHHIAVGDILYRWARDKYEKDGIEVIHFTGDMSGLEKHEAATKFQSAKRAIGILSTLAYGEGINLQTCADAIMLEREWNPANEAQAAPGRHRRIGSIHKVVNVVYPNAVGTVDDILDSINSRKLHAFHNTMNKTEMIQWNQTSFAKELADRIVKNWRAR